MQLPFSRSGDCIGNGIAKKAMDQFSRNVLVKKLGFEEKRVLRYVLSLHKSACGKVVKVTIKLSLKMGTRQHKC